MPARIIAILLPLWFSLSFFPTSSASEVIENLSAQEFFNDLIEAGVVDREALDHFISSLTFQDVFTSMKPMELLKTLSAHGLIKITDMNSLHAELSRLNIDLSRLRSDGVLTELSGALGGSLLTMPSWDVKAKLEQIFETDKTTFLDYWEKEHLLMLLDGFYKTSSTDERRELNALTWHTVGDEVNNMETFYWIGNMPNILPNVQDAVNKVMQKPVGQRFIFSWALHLVYRQERNPGTTLSWNSNRTMFDVTDAQGNLLEFDMIWMDQWRDIVRERFTNFFRDYKAMGGELDQLVLDLSEIALTQGYMEWRFMIQRQSYFQTPTGKKVWQTIMEDPRWPEVARELGFSDLTNAPNWNREEPQKELIWNAVMHKRKMQYIQEAIVEPMLQYFPEAKVSNYQWAVHSQTVTHDFGPTWTPGWHRTGVFPHESWVQTRSVYGEWIKTINMGPKTFPSPDRNQRNSFDTFLYDFSAIRNMLSASDIPLTVWLARKSFAKGAFSFWKKDPLTGIMTSGYDYDHYSEMVFHAALSGAEDFLYFNDHGGFWGDQTPRTTED
ncbi:MAG: hypothetical protein HY584_06365, partial [Candidatus Omnitrophica bacterium]|nr:hypothetical protein [Candidatus Omnitrophota bacterium]